MGVGLLGGGVARSCHLRGWGQVARPVIQNEKKQKSCAETVFIGAPLASIHVSSSSQLSSSIVALA
jgi:hypothetical protein